MYQTPRSQAAAACSATRRPQALIMPEMVCGCLPLERNSSTKVLPARLFRRRRPVLYQHRRPVLYHRRPLYLGRHETGRDQKKIGRIGRRIESTAFEEKMTDTVDGDWSCTVRWIPWVPLAVDAASGIDRPIDIPAVVHEDALRTAEGRLLLHRDRRRETGGMKKAPLVLLRHCQKIALPEKSAAPV